MTKYGKTFVTPKQTPQTQPIPGREIEMERNAAGGFGFKMTDVDRFRRWLILGSEGGTHYQDEEALTKENFAAIDSLIKSSPEQVIPTILEVRKNKWALRQSPAVFALAYASTKDAVLRQAALSVLLDILWDGSQLMEFIASRKDILGKAKSSRALRTAIGKWYTSKDIDSLTYQLTKYRTRNKFSHEDILNLFHVHPANADQEQLFAWIAAQNMPDEIPSALKGERREKLMAQRRKRTRELAALALKNNRKLAGFIALQATTDEDTAAGLIREHHFTREMVPTELLNSPIVWEALVEYMPYEALIRSLNKITQVGLVGLFGAGEWVKRITDVALIRRSHVHPMRILTAWKQYAQGKGEKGSLVWTPHGQIAQALEQAFYLSFENVEASDTKTVVAIDVSGSMEDSPVYGLSNMMPWEAAAAFTLVYLKSNPKTHVIAFDDHVTPLPHLHAGMSLGELMNIFARLSHGGTNCALPFEYIKSNGIKPDGVLMVTDSETWHGHQHVTQARDNTIRFFNIQTTASRASIHDPTDTGWMEVNGFSADTLKLAELFFKRLI